MSTIDGNYGNCDQLQYSSSMSKFELFHTPSFGDEDFEFASTSGSTVVSSTVSSWASPPDDKLTTRTVRSGNEVTGDTRSSTTSPVTSGHRLEAISHCDNMTSHYDDVFLSPYCSSDNGHMLNRGDYLADRKYVTALYQPPDNVALSPSVPCHNNNNNNNENNFRSHAFSLPTSQSSMALKHFESSEFQTFSYQSAQRSPFETTASFHRADHRNSGQQTDQLQIAAMQYESAAVPAGTAYNGSAVSSSSAPSSAQLDDGGGCRPGPLINGFFPPRYETATTTSTSSSSPTTKKPRTTKKRKKKDSNEPQKPVSAYALFFRDTQAAIKSHNPSASFGEMSKIVASMWDSLDDIHKNIYRKRTEMAKKTYLKQLATYRASQLTKDGVEDDSSGHQQSMPSRSPTAPDTTGSPNNLTANCVSNQQAAPLSHLSVDGVCQVSPHYAMTSSQRIGLTDTSHYDIYGAPMTGNSNNHLMHQSSTTTPAMNIHQLYQQQHDINGGNVTAQSCNSLGGGGLGGFVNSTTVSNGVRWANYCSAHEVATQSQKLECQPPQATWWIR